MVDLAIIGGISSSVAAAVDIAKGLVGLRDEAMISEKAVQLQSALANALATAVQAQTELYALAEENRRLKEELAAAAEWGPEAAKYELRQIPGGLTVYARRADAEPEEAPHWLCPACFTKKRKGYLQNNGREKTHEKWKCASCNAEGKAFFGYRPDNERG